MKNRRGRPQGDGIDDGQALSAIADLVVANPKLKLAKAIRSLDPNLRVGHSEAAVTRRLQSKWAQRHDALLKAARQRDLQMQKRKANDHLMEAERLKQRIGEKFSQISGAMEMARGALFGEVPAIIKAAGVNSEKRDAVSLTRQSIICRNIAFSNKEFFENIERSFGLLKSINLAESFRIGSAAINSAGDPLVDLRKAASEFSERLAKGF